MTPRRECSVPDCDRRQHAKGYCMSHYRRSRSGNLQEPIRPRGRLTPEERFWAKVDRSGDCWIWLGARRGSGYGGFTHSGKMWRVHRLSYTWANGHIPYGLDVDHTCRQRLCVNPAHLQAVSRALNLQNIGNVRASKSGIRGVVWHKPSSLWLARATVNGVGHSAGYHKTIPEAEAAVIQLRNRIMTNNLLDRIA